MKRLLLLLPALIAIYVVSARGRIEEFTLRSAILGADKTCSVYLPENYDATSGDYPVLYLLHGAYGDHTSWVKMGTVRRIADEAIEAGVARPMIIVMPDASGEGENRAGRHMGYFNVPGWDYERFFFKEFMPAVEKRYRIRGDKSNRAIAGLSMGGGGSAVYALRHPELFGAACPLSGLMDAFPDSRDYESVFVKSVADNSPVSMLREMSDEALSGVRSIRWWVDCGDDDFLWQSNLDFYSLMRRRDIPLQYRMRDGGHTWRYWQQALPDVLTFISVGFGK